MNLNIPEKYQRPITGAALLIILALCLGLGGWPLRLLVLAASLAALYEFYSLFLPGREGLKLKILGLFCGAVVVLGQAFSPMMSVMGVVISFWAAGLFFLFSFGKEGNEGIRLQSYTPLFLGVVYVPVALHLALYMSLEEQILIMGAAILTDTGGYFVGMFLGKHKVWPTVSPKKTWEGSAGGLVCCTAFCVAAGFLAAKYELALPTLPLWVWIFVGIILNFASQMGDFFESALKRTMGVKDSGTLLPGHGGVLDRIDSVLLALPAYMLIRILTGGF